MIHYERIDTLPRAVTLQLSAYAWEEVRAAHDLGVDIVGDSEFKVVVYDGETPLTAAGVTRPALLGPATMWFLLCHDFHAVKSRSLRPLMAELLTIYPRLETSVEKSLRPLCRFAQFFGFRPTGREYNLFGRHYEVYEARK